MVGGPASRWNCMGPKGATLLSTMTGVETPRSLWLKSVTVSSWWGHIGVDTKDGKDAKVGSKFALAWLESVDLVKEFW